jgi:hypothetical protein
MVTIQMRTTIAMKTHVGLLDLIGVTLCEDNEHTHGGTTTLKNELRVYLI